jgi:hypothetical protein
MNREGLNEKHQSFSPGPALVPESASSRPIVSMHQDKHGSSSFKAGVLGCWLS